MKLPISLPLFVTWSNRVWVAALMYGLSYFIYYLTNHFPILAPVALPLTVFDRIVPFMPYSIYIYISEYFYFAFVFFLLKDVKNINRYMYAYTALQVFACLFFLMCPTIYPRDEYPIPSDLPDFLIQTWTWLRTQDAPTNCLPSLHVSSVYISGLAFYTEGQKNKGHFFMVWSTLIAISTLTTKQHYLVDLLSGFTLAFALHYWFHYRQPYNENH